MSIGSQEYIVSNTEIVGKYIDDNIGVDFEIENDPWSLRGSITIFEVEDNEHTNLLKYIKAEKLSSNLTDEHLNKHLTGDGIEVYHQVSDLAVSMNEELLLLKAAGDGMLGSVNADITGDANSQVIFNIGDAFFWETQVSPVEKKIAIARLDGTDFVEQQYFTDSYLALFNKVLEEKGEPSIDITKLVEYYKRGEVRIKEYAPLQKDIISAFVKKVEQIDGELSTMVDIFSILETPKETPKEIKEEIEEEIEEKTIASQEDSVEEVTPAEEVIRVEEEIEEKTEAPIIPTTLNHKVETKRPAEQEEKKCIISILKDENKVEEDLLESLLNTASGQGSFSF